MASHKLQINRLKIWFQASRIIDLDSCWVETFSPNCYKVSHIGSTVHFIAPCPIKPISRPQMQFQNLENELFWAKETKIASRP